MRPTKADPDGRDLVAYIEATRPLQQAVSQVLTQVAGCSLIIMTRPLGAARPAASMESAQLVARRAAEDLRAVRVPTRAAHHFHHLEAASETLGAVFVSLELCARPNACEADRETLSRALKTVSDHLRATARLLPGFETIDFSQACCAVHAPPGFLAQQVA